MAHVQQQVAMSRTSKSLPAGASCPVLRSSRACARAAGVGSHAELQKPQLLLPLQPALPAPSVTARHTHASARRSIACAAAKLKEHAPTAAHSGAQTVPQRPSAATPGAILTFDSCTSKLVKAHLQGSAASSQSVLPEPTLQQAGSLNLTPADHFFSVLGWTTWAFVFPTPIDHTAATEALGHVLRLYPILAGHCRRTQDGKGVDLWWDLQSDGLPLLRATSSLTAQQLMPSKAASVSADGSRLLGQAPADMSLLDQGLAQSAGEVIDGGAPLARAALVQLAPDGPGQEGGTLLSIAAHHVILDGRSIRQIMMAWAAQTRAILAARSGPQAAATAAPPRLEQPSFGRQCWDEFVARAQELGLGQAGNSPEEAQHTILGLTPPPPTPAPTSQQPTGSSSRDPGLGEGPVDMPALVGPRAPHRSSHPFAPALVFYFSGQQLSQLKAQANAVLHTYSYDSGGSEDEESEPVTFVSSNDVVCARMWQVLSSLPTNDPAKPTRFLRATDMRQRLDRVLAHRAGGSRTPDSRASSPQPEHPHGLPGNAVGNWVYWATTIPMPVAQTPLGHVAAELRRILGPASRPQALASLAYWDWAAEQGLTERVFLTGTTLWAPEDADSASTSWDFVPQDLDFGGGATPAWLQRAAPDFIQNHIVVVSDLMPEEGSPSGKPGKAAGLWVFVGLPEPKMQALAARGFEVCEELRS